MQVLQGVNAKVFAEWAADVKIWLEFSVDQSSPLWPNFVVSQALLQWLGTANAGLSFDQVFVGDDPEADDEDAGTTASALYTAWAMPRDAHPGAQLARKAIRADLALSWALAQLGDTPLGHTTLVVDYLGAPSWATRGFALSPATVRSLARGTGQLEIRQRFDSLTPQARTEALRARILELAGRPGRVTVSEIAAHIGVEHDRVRAVMRDLVDEGLVPTGQRTAETSEY